MRAKEGFAMSQLPDRPRRPALYRSPRGRMLAGVCAGLAEKTGLSPWVFRLVFIVGNFLPGPGLIAYLILWAVVPMREDTA